MLKSTPAWKKYTTAIAAVLTNMSYAFRLANPQLMRPACKLFRTTAVWHICGLPDSVLQTSTLRPIENWDLDENLTVANVVPTAWINATPWTKSALQSDEANLQFQRANSSSDVYFSFDRVARVGHEGLGFHRSNIAKGTTDPRVEFCLPK